MSSGYVAVVHHACPYCGKKDNGDILIHTRFRDISEVHNKTIGWEVCSDCQKGLDMGGIGIIIADEDLSGKSGLEDVYRCGCVNFVTVDYINRLLDYDPVKRQDVLRRKFLVMDYRVAEKFGFPTNNYKPNANAADTMEYGHSGGSESPQGEDQKDPAQAQADQLLPPAKTDEGNEDPPAQGPEKGAGDIP